MAHTVVTGIPRIPPLLLNPFSLVRPPHDEDAGLIGLELVGQKGASSFCLTLVPTVPLLFMNLSNTSFMYLPFRHKMAWLVNIMRFLVWTHGFLKRGGWLDMVQENTGVNKKRVMGYGIAWHGCNCVLGTVRIGSGWSVFAMDVWFSRVRIYL